jgi:hypothetical protein
MPLTCEHRIFFLDGRPLYSIPYWDDVAYQGTAPPLDALAPIASRVRSRFFTMDVALGTDGTWIIVELGDAQVSGLPERADVGAFYRALVSAREAFAGA